MAAILELVLTDPELLSPELLDGPKIYVTEELTKLKVPMVGYTMIVDTEGESTDEWTVQWDITAPSVSRQLLIEERLRTLVAGRGERIIGGLRIRVEFEVARSHPAPAPGERHRSFDVRYNLSQTR